MEAHGLEPSSDEVCTEPRGWTPGTYCAVSLSSLNGSFLMKLQSKSDPGCHPVTAGYSVFARCVVPVGRLSVRVIDT